MVLIFKTRRCALRNIIATENAIRIAMGYGEAVPRKRNAASASRRIKLKHRLILILYRFFANNRYSKIRVIAAVSMGLINAALVLVY